MSQTVFYLLVYLVSADLLWDHMDYTQSSAVSCRGTMLWGELRNLFSIRRWLRERMGPPSLLWLRS